MKIKRLKTIVLILLILTSVLYATAQDKRFAAYTYTDPVATKKDGFNIGFGIEYQMSIMYFKAQTFVFPDLRGKDYLDYTGTVGFNYHNFWNNIRLFTGLKLGSIIRDNAPNATWGFEIGFEFYPNATENGIYYGVQFSKDRRTDNTVWEAHAEPYWRDTGVVKVGYAFN